MNKTINNLTMNYKNGWIITFDEGVCNDCDNATEEQMKVIIADGFTQPFRLLDDDEIPYYVGHCKPDMDDEFAPLEDWGMPNAGCTMIQHQVGDNWETL